jgi:hypothetical protein
MLTREFLLTKGYTKTKETNENKHKETDNRKR